DDFWADCQLAPFRGIGNQSAHPRNALFVDKIDNKLEFVQTFEISKLGRITRVNESFKASANERACAAAKYCLLAKKIGLRFLPKSRFEHAGTCAADSFCPSQGRLRAAPAWILMNCDQRRRATSSQKFPTYHWSEAFGRDHHNIDILGWNDGAIVNGKTVCKEQRLAGTQIRSDLFRVNGRHLRV